MPREPEPEFRPFADDAAVRNFANLSFENGTTRIALHGSLDLTRDRAGLERAKALRAVLDAIVTALEAEDLPQAVAETTRPPTIVKNPFA
ncbi:hypothetical protein [Methylobacterium haplocladii]|uniref:Uncharacterized protein n=1 Tax=Methylobacterium haplocladii TaxID=1176176 RepID=A0A512IVR7_9HYPH|nr:hypothetical protein [Methylobacterium haplocladii]GEP01820.1 hypothetical protein MHA02_42070 [Methylobacterium haplocladii]GJD85715.1 hypothetical protein HPGCJGGD_3606 [Methylobacterium haplocladii]GLS61105.1 hypothetical protein GCM10007887_37990 [Methylobacterium haplocladii]